ncbi:MAG: EamA family transporter [Desulfuromonas sp.]|nr:MAG: EamA family transporter [Desulfuromonas sp.]
MADRRQAYLYALGAVLIWSTMAAAFKLSLRHLDPLQLLFFSVLVALVFLGTLLGYQGKIGQVFRCRRRDYAMSLLLGLLNPFLYYLVLLKAYELLPAQQAQPINYTWAITLTLLSIPLLKQKIRCGEFAAMLVSYCGVVVIATEGELLHLQIVSPLGVGLALASTLAWSFYWIFNTLDQRDPLVALFMNFAAAFPFIGAALYLFSDMIWPSPAGFAGAAYIGLMEMGASFVLWLLALKKTDNAARLGSLIFLSPFLSLVLIALLVGERILPSTGVGLVLIVAGLVLQKKVART